MDLSTRLSYLFGTEEYVGTRRQLVLLREKLMNHLHRMEKQNLYSICSGSLGDGVAYPMSDDDVMICDTNKRVVKTHMEATRIGDVLMVLSEYSPGYCLLLDINGTQQENCIAFMYERPILSSSLFKQFFLRGLRQSARIHGPCIAGIYGSVEANADYSRCISCSFWPDAATEWYTRKRSNNWPLSGMIRNIIQNGCHVVPVGDPESPYCDHEWRISFSVAERNLMHSFNHIQFLVYNLLRLTLKMIIEKQFPGVLCSYFMKTTLFYTAENTPLHLWRESNLESCFKICLSVLYDYVDYIYCPNYFLPEYNMMKSKINHTNRHGMLDIIKTIHNIGIIGILHVSGESLCLDDTLSTTDIEYKLDREFMVSDLLYQVFYSIEDVFRSLPHAAAASYTYCLSTFCCIISEYTRNELMFMMWYRGTNSYCLTIMDCFFTLPKTNKHKYRLYKTLLPMLTIGSRKDVTTGKLTMATYMYLVGKTEVALIVIQDLLSAYPTYAIDDNVVYLEREAYTDFLCGRGYSIDYKARRAYVPDYSIYVQFVNAFPYPMKIWMSIMENIAIDTLTYTFFLHSLCYVQHRNLILVKKSLKCLVRHIDGLKYDIQKVNARMCVGFIKYVQGDYQSAFKWLASVYSMADELPPPLNEKYSRSVLSYLSIFLNKHFISEML